MAYMRSGFGVYDQVRGSYEWMFYPPPYQFADPAKLTPPPQFYAPAKTMGLGCGGGCSSCAHGGRCEGKPQIGLGLFDSADWTAWGLGEWVTIGVGLYLGISIISDLGRAGKSVRKRVSKRRSRARRKKELQEELATI